MVDKLSALIADLRATVADLIKLVADVQALLNHPAINPPRP